MKKKIFTLLTLLLCVCSGAWAADWPVAFGTGTRTFTGDATSDYSGTTKATTIYSNDGKFMLISNGNALDVDESGGLKFGGSSASGALMFYINAASNITVTVRRNGTDTDINLDYMGSTKPDNLISSNTTTGGTNCDTKSVTSNGTDYTLTKSAGAAGYYKIYSSKRFMLKSIAVVSTGPTCDITFALPSGASGVVPTAKTGVSGTITLPKNTSMWYADGYSLTKWVDESANEYEPGSDYTVSANQTLTAKFESNGGTTFADRTAATTVKWGPWTQNLNIPVLNFNGTSGFVVAQASVAGKTIDVKLPIDATTGKFVNQPTNTWTQVNPGVVFTIPAADGATITYKQYDNGATTTPEVTATGNTYELTSAGTSGQLYYEYIQVVLPGPTYTVSTTLTNVTKTSGDATVEGGTEYTATFAAADGYVLPTSVEVTAGGSDITANCTWTKATGTLTIPAAYVTGNIAITIEGVAVAGTTMIKAVLQSSSSATITGTVQGMYSANSDVYNRDNTKGGCKLGKDGAWVCITLTSGWTFKAGDIVNVNIGTAGSGGTFAFYKESTGTNAILTTTEGPTAGLHTFVLPATANNEASLYLVRKASSNFNPYVDYIEVIRPNSTVTLNASGFATYSAGNDFTYLGADAYTMALDLSGEGSLTGTKITAGTKIPAGAGILFKGEAGAKVSLINTEGASDLAASNSLLGTTNNEGNLVDVPTGKSIYALSGNTFKPYTGDAFAPNKAYFAVAPSLSRTFTMSFDDETTGISAVENTKPEVKDNVYYNLNGQRVANPSKGLFIVNGKKVIIK